MCEGSCRASAGRHADAGPSRPALPVGLQAGRPAGAAGRPQQRCRGAAAALGLRAPRAPACCRRRRGCAARAAAGGAGKPATLQEVAAIDELVDLLLVRPRPCSGARLPAPPLPACTCWRATRDQAASQCNGTMPV